MFKDFLKKINRHLPVRSPVDCKDDALGLFAITSEDIGESSLCEEIDVDGDAWILICNESNPELWKENNKVFKSVLSFLAQMWDE